MSKQHLALRMSWPRAWPVLVTVCVSLGCGGRGEVEGKITYGGKTLTVGTVTFLNGQDEAVGSSPISPEGRYAMVKVPSGPVKILVIVPQAKGAIARRRPPPPKGKEPPPQMVTPPVAIPAKYSDPHQSDLTYTVESGAQEFDIHLK